MRQDLIDAKKIEIQKMLDQWAREENILDAGKRILFSIRVEDVELVADEDGAPSSAEGMNPKQFFTREKLLEAGATKPSASRALTCVANECRSWQGSPEITTMRQFLERNYSVAVLLRTPNLGHRSVVPMVKLILEAGLSIGGGQAFLERYSDS